MTERRRWSETFRALGSAVLGLLKAELEAFEHDVARSTKQAAIGIGLFVAAGAFGFWTLGVATYFLIQLLALWLPLWGASLAVTLAFAVVVAVLALIGSRKLQRWQNPLTTARERMDDHIEWWQGRVFAPGAGAKPIGGGTGRDDDADAEVDQPGESS
jgi:hypothetical protein